VITARQAVLAQKASYVRDKPLFSAFDGAVSGFLTTTVDDELLITFEGTHNRLGWGLDFWARLTRTAPVAGHPRLPASHKGFTAAVDELIPHVRETVTGKKFHIIGHSLGGGVGLNLAARLADSGQVPEAIWLFAPARVFVDAPDVLVNVPLNAWRCGGDIVPMVPPWCWRPIMTHLPGPDNESAHGIDNFVQQIN
jgi:Lipase (class 3)